MHNNFLQYANEPSSAEKGVQSSSRSVAHILISFGGTHSHLLPLQDCKKMKTRKITPRSHLNPAKTRMRSIPALTPKSGDGDGGRRQGLVQSWKTGLDSLLVFVRVPISHFFGAKSENFQAGLFAGVLAAFLLESRNGLQDDPHQVLLREINQALRNESSTSAAPLTLAEQTRTPIPASNFGIVSAFLVYF
jgi:hypothetical protein